ncbi:MAG: chemotaxis protein CheW [Candidatus Marinimicrobia bacterium]|nr:chemotaxis protein CheW [Candidatus Neomarinimicrobiota bacterium]
MTVTSIRTKDKSSSDAASEIRQLVIFKLAEGSFGLDIRFVREINRLMEVTPIPTAPEYVEGIMNLRGAVVPVVSLGLRFGLEKSETTKDSRIVVIESNQNLLGLVVDEVSEVLRLPSSDVESSDNMAMGGVNVDFIEGVGKVDGRLILLLAPDKLFTDEEQAQLAEIVA